MKKLGVAGLVSVLVWVVVVGVAAAGDPKPCDPGDKGYCLDLPPGPQPDPKPGPQPGPPPVCVWRNMDPTWSPGVDLPFWSDFGVTPPPAGASVVWQEHVCTRPDGSTTLGRPPYRWVITVTTADLARVAGARIEGLLGDPVVASDPAPGKASILKFPVFVQVTNWTGTITDGECTPSGSLCATVTATPQLMYRPGEPDAHDVACTGSGSRFDPATGDPFAQAAIPGACTWAYQHRTGAEGRPEAWPAVVSVTWTITWTGTGDPRGSLPPVTLSTPVPRAVNEVQTIIEGGSGG